MALIHPRSLERWQEWHDSRSTGAVRHALTAALRRGSEEPAAFTLHSRDGDGEGRILLGLDRGSETGRIGLLAALPYLHRGVDVVTLAGEAPPELDGPGWHRTDLDAPTATLDGRGITAVATHGWHEPVGRLVHEWSLAADVPSSVVQDDALTPYAAPLPPHTTLLAWSDADAEFHRSGRGDVETRTVGSQRLWEAAHEEPGDDLLVDDRPVFLGQIGRPELRRRVTAGEAMAFCRRGRALYLPDPAETDRLSRVTHRLMRRRGVVFAASDEPLREAGRPVVGIFATGVLEAAVRGRPAWVLGEDVPAWVHEFWERYGLRRFGGDPTPAPPIAADEPARLLAQILEGTA